jgi:hypothetical protein
VLLVREYRERKQIDRFLTCFGQTSNIQKQLCQNRALFGLNVWVRLLASVKARAIRSAFAVLVAGDLVALLVIVVNRPDAALRPIAELFLPSDFFIAPRPK